jgi:hypothetical protein
MKDGVTLKGGKKSGVAVNNGGEFTMSGGTIGGNTATSLGPGVHGAFTKTGDAVIWILYIHQF